MSGGEWEPDAEDWVRWARTPGHDAYWYYRDGFFDSLLPAPGRHTLEVGCGEGRVARDLGARGHRVTAVDTAATLVRSARDEDASSRYAAADSAALPFADEQFDLVVAYNSLQVVADMAASVAEIARVLEPGGRLCAVIAHPVTDLGTFTDQGLVIRSGYFENRRVDDTVEMRGLKMRFRGWTQSLENYAVAFEAAGLVIETMREPRPAPEGRPADDRWRDLPLFLFLRLRRS